LVRKTGNAGGARACIPNGKAKWFYHSDLSSFGTVQSTLGVGGCGREIFSSATCQLQVGVGRYDADELRQHESSGLFLAFHLLAFHKKLDKDLFVFVQQNSTPLVWPCLLRRAHPFGNDVAK
jgi:hypothetical protein